MITSIPTTNPDLVSDILNQIAGPLDYAIAVIDAVELCLDSMTGSSGTLPTVDVSLINEWRTSRSLLNLARDQIRTAFEVADQAEVHLS